MSITLPSFVAPNELIQSAWGNGVVNALNELDVEKLDLAGGELTGTLTINRGTSGTPLILKQGNEVPALRFQSQAGTDMAVLAVSASSAALDTLNNNPFLVVAPTTITHEGGSQVLTLKAVTETPRLTFETVAGTDLLWLTGSSSDSTIDAFDNLVLRGAGTDILTLDGGTLMVTTGGGLTTTSGLTVGTFATIAGTIDHNGSLIGFNGATPTAQSGSWGAPTGTATKTTFATSTVTTEQLAQRVKAIIDYLILRGDFGT